MEIEVIEFGAEIKRNNTSMPVARTFPHIKTAMTRDSQQPFIFHEFGEVWLRRNDPKCSKARH